MKKTKPANTGKAANSITARSNSLGCRSGGVSTGSRFTGTSRVRKFSGTSRVAMTSKPRLVVSSFQWCNVYNPAPNSAAVMPEKIRNGK